MHEIRRGLVTNTADSTALKNPLIERNKFEDRPPQAREDQSAVATMESLLNQSNAELAATNSKGQTLLHVAAYCGYLSVVKLLIDKGAQKNTRDHSNRTPLELVILSLLEIRSERFSSRDLKEEWGDMAGTFHQIIQSLVEGEPQQVLSDACKTISEVDQEKMGIKTADKETIRTVFYTKYLMQGGVSIPSLGKSLLPQGSF
ncbi:MAG: hypothetical protein ChlgKO_12940 [Chlamydiales bacterium]